MAVVVVAANNSRINSADSATSWSNFGGGGPSPAAEPQLRYQGSNAVNRKVTATTSRQGVHYDPGTGAVNMTLAANRLWLAKVYVADFGDLNSTFGVGIVLGSANSAFFEWNVAGSSAARSVFSAYPAQGGYLLVALDPNIASWRAGTGTGSPDLAAVDYFGARAQFVTGGAKSENLAVDAIDVGTGLTLTRGDGADPDGTFQDFVNADQGTVANRWGYATQSSGAIFFRGMATLGAAGVPTEFSDSASVVFFPDGYHSAGLFGITCNLSNAGTSITLRNLIVGRGSSVTADTRPDFNTTGTSGSLLLGAVLRNFRQINLTSAATVSGAAVECGQLTQGGATITASEIRTTSAAAVACLQGPTFTALSDLDFVQAGAGHALVITSPGSYTLSKLRFSGYGATASNSAAIFNNSGGAVTLNISGGDTPTFRNGAGASTTVLNAVTVRVTVTDAVSGSPIQSARVYLKRVSDSQVILTGLTSASGVVEDTGYNYTADQAVTGHVRKATGSPRYKSAPLSGSIRSTGYEATVPMILDE